MLFRVYSRYVSNLTRQAGSAMERLLASQMSQGALIEIPMDKGADHCDGHDTGKESGQGSGHASGKAVQTKTTYVPAQYTAPMATPKPRGLPGRTGVPKFGEVIPPIETVGVRLQPSLRRVNPP
jgi:integrase